MWAETVFGATTSRSAICRLVQAGGDQLGDLEFARAQRVPRIGLPRAAGRGGEPVGGIGQGSGADGGREVADLAGQQRPPHPGAGTWAAAAARSSRAQAPSQNRCRSRHAPLAASSA